MYSYLSTQHPSDLNFYFHGPLGVDDNPLDLEEIFAQADRQGGKVPQDRAGRDVVVGDAGQLALVVHRGQGRPPSTIVLNHGCNTVSYTHLTLPTNREV